MHTPTDEQAHAVDAFRAGRHLVLQAGAGTGKTSTLGLLGASTQARGRYLAFNRDIARDAAARFPRTVVCRTAHATAYAAVGHRYTGRLNSPRQPAWKSGQALGITRPVRIGDHEISARALTHAVLRTVSRYCHSADRVLARHHVPCMRGLNTSGEQAQLTDAVMPFATKAWADLLNPEQGVVRFEHDHYLKMWALTEPKLEADFLFLDEAQDTNPVLEEVFNAQRDHAQLVMVGDSAQAIYGWRGARDVLTGFDATALALTQSFRFGPLIAAEANRWLALADAPIRLTGAETVPTTIGDLDCPDAVLCRTNIGAMAEVMRLLSASTTASRSPEENSSLPHWPLLPATSRAAAAPPILSSCSSPPGASCRTTPRTTPQGATSNPSSTSSTPTDPMPSSPPSTNSPMSSMPT